MPPTTPDAAPWTVGQLRAELVGLPDDQVISVLVQSEPGGTFYSPQVLTSAGYGEGVDPDDAMLTGAPFPLQTQFASVTDEPEPPSRRRH